MQSLVLTISERRRERMVTRDSTFWRVRRLAVQRYDRRVERAFPPHSEYFRHRSLRHWIMDLCRSMVRSRTDAAARLDYGEDL
jgi:hypothetical protein